MFWADSSLMLYGLFPCFVFAVVADLFAVASEIGPGFSPGIESNHKWGFSPWDMSSYPRARPLKERRHIPGAKAPFGGRIECQG
jgi:hypothetical protein